MNLSDLDDIRPVERNKSRCEQQGHSWIADYDKGYFCSVCHITKKEIKPMGGLVSVQLTINSMKSQIEQCLFDHADTIKASISHELNGVTQNFNFEGQVRMIAERTLKTEVERMVKEATEKAIRESEWMTNWIQSAVVSEINRNK